MILGVEAHGTRTTTTTPTGEVGNDAPLVRVEESWWANGFGILMRQVVDDPRSGKRTREPVNFVAGEPSARLFDPPEGYEVVDETLHPVPCQN
jgi:hypothetical protein